MDATGCSSLESAGRKGARIRIKWVEFNSFPMFMEAGFHSKFHSDFLSLFPSLCNFSMAFLEPQAFSGRRLVFYPFNVSGSSGVLSPRCHQEQKSMRTFEFGPLKTAVLPIPPKNEGASQSPSQGRLASVALCPILWSYFLGPYVFLATFTSSPKHYTPVANGKINTFSKRNSH